MTTLYNDLLKYAYKARPLQFEAPNREQMFDVMRSANALLYLIIDERHNGVKEPYHSKILEHVRKIISGGLEPCCDVVQVWAYPATACAITLCKKTPTIWTEFTTFEIEKLDIIMTAFAVMSNFIANDANHYKTGFGLLGDVDKNRIANFKFPHVVPGIAAAHYFGGDDELDDILINFDYDNFIEKAESFNFVNIIERYTTPNFVQNDFLYPGAKEIMLNEGDAFIHSHAYGDISNIYDGGWGKGVKIPYLYQEKRATDIGIIEYLVAHNHSGGVCTARVGDLGGGKYLGYTHDGSETPMVGRDGMLIEYNYGNGNNIRTSGHYCSVDFAMEIALLLMVKELGIWSERDNAELYEKIWVGNEDHIYKMQVGYHGQAMCVKHYEEGNNLRGYLFMRTLWYTYFQQLS